MTRGRAISTWLELLRADDVRQAMSTIRECPQPTLCFVLADRDGHIGLQGCGRFPQRINPHAGLLPVPAWEQQNQWSGWLDSKHLPSMYDPPEGFVATANEPRNPPNGPLLVTQIVPDYRYRRIQEALGELDLATVEDMQRLHYDLVSVQARDLLDEFMPHLPDGPLKDELSKWDYRYDPDSHQATLFQRLYRHVMVEMLGTDRGVGWRRMLYLCTRVGYSTMILTAADHMLFDDQSWWWVGRDKGQIIRRAASRVGTEKAPTWSRINNFHFTNRFFGNHQVGRLLGFHSREYPMPGNHATLFQGHVFQTAAREQTFAPCYHFVTDFQTDDCWTNLPGGPSESRFSRYYKTGLSDWLAGKYRCLRVDASSRDDGKDSPNSNE